MNSSRRTARPASRSTLRIASTARRATSRTRPRTSTGSSRKAAEDPIIRTCKQLPVLAALVVAGAAAPAAANPAAYVEARVAADQGASERASRSFRTLLAADPQSRLVAQRALDHGLAAGDWPL